MDTFIFAIPKQICIFSTTTSTITALLSVEVQNHTLSNTIFLCPLVVYFIKVLLNTELRAQVLLTPNELFNELWEMHARMC